MTDYIQAKGLIKGYVKAYGEDMPAYMRRALELSMEALDKQIPVTPGYEDGGFDEEGQETWYPVCISCHSELDEDYTYCPTCGQRIEWSD